MKQFRYIVFRHGSNSANQSMCDSAIVADVNAESASAACTEAAEHVTVYANQRLDAVLYSRAGRSNCREADDMSELREAFCPLCGRTELREAWQGAMINDCECQEVAE